MRDQTNKILFSGRIRHKHKKTLTNKYYRLVIPLLARIFQNTPTTNKTKKKLFLVKLQIKPYLTVRFQMKILKMTYKIKLFQGMFFIKQHPLSLTLSDYMS